MAYGTMRRATDMLKVNPLVLLLPSKVQPKYSFGNNHSALQLCRSGWGGGQMRSAPHNLAFSQFRLKARIQHLEGSAPSDLNQINFLYICGLRNAPSFTHH